MTRIIVAGSRTFNDYQLLSKELDDVIRTIGDTVEIVSGGANGADKLGERYASERGLCLAHFTANWDKYGKSAGMIRNKDMLDYAMHGSPYLVAFWDGKSKGTENMINRAKRAGVPAHVFLVE